MARSNQTYKFPRQGPISKRERDAQHQEDIERARHNLTQRRPAKDSIMVRRALAYTWRDPQELRGLVDDCHLARWTAPRMPR